MACSASEAPSGPDCVWHTPSGTPNLVRTGEKAYGRIIRGPGSAPTNLHAAAPLTWRVDIRSPSAAVSVVLRPRPRFSSLHLRHDGVHGGGRARTTAVRTSWGVVFPPSRHLRCWIGTCGYPLCGVLRCQRAAARRVFVGQIVAGRWRLLRRGSHPWCAPRSATPGISLIAEVRGGCASRHW